MLKNSFLALCLCLAVSLASAEVTKRYPFQDGATEARFSHLTSTLRCVVCQNQNLAESSAGIANDLKDRIYHDLLRGESDEAILQALRSRYGDFILFSPPVESKTLPLWVFPWIMFIFGAFIIFRMTRRA